MARMKGDGRNKDDGSGNAKIIGSRVREENNNCFSGAAKNENKSFDDYKSYLKRIVYLNLFFYFIAYSSISYTLVLSNSLFLKKAGPEFIPARFIVLNSLLVLFEIALITFKKIPEFKVLVLSITAGTIYTFLCNIFFFEYNHYLIYFFYFVAGYIFIIMTLFGYLTYLNDILPLREQKKYMPYIHGVSSLGAVISGFSLNFLLPLISVSGVLNIIIVLNIISLFLIFIIDNNYRKMKSKNFIIGSEWFNPEVQDADESKIPGGFVEEEYSEDIIKKEGPANDNSNEIDEKRTKVVFENECPRLNVVLVKRLREAFDYARNTNLAYYLILLIFIVNFKEAVIDFVFSSRLAEEFLSVNEMAAFNGTFRAVNMLVIMAAQFFILKPFLNHFSVAAAMIIMPFAVIPFTVAGLIFNFFSTIISIKFFYEISFKCFNRPAVGIFTNAIAERKTQVFVFYEISAYASKILAGVVLYSLKPWLGTYYFIYLILFLSLIYYHYLSKLEPAYIQALESSLEAGTAKEKISTIERYNYLPVSKTLETAALFLKSNSFEERLKAVNKISEYNGASRYLYEALVRETNPVVIATIISKLSADPKTASVISAAVSGTDRNVDLTRRFEVLFNHEDRRVRANLIEGLANFYDYDESAVISGKLCAYLNDGDYRIRSAAIISVLELSEDELEIKKAIDGLYDMSVMNEYKARASAAYVMGKLKLRSFINVLAKLINDDEIRVRNYSIIALINIGGTESEEILRGRLTIESDAKITAMIDSGLKTMANMQRKVIYDMLKTHSIEFRNRAVNILKNIDIILNYQLVIKILLINFDEVKLELLKCISENKDDLKFIKFIDSLISSDGAMDFKEYVKFALANKFKFEDRYIELYGVIAPFFEDENRRYIFDLINICAAAVNYIKIFSSGEDGVENTQKMMNINCTGDYNNINMAPQCQMDAVNINAADLLNFIFECAALSSGKYEKLMKNFRAALLTEPSVSSYAVELIEMALDDEIAGKIIDLIENYKEIKK